jgi:hypothetical protein
MIDCQTTRVRIARVLIVSIFAAISVTADVLVGTGTSVAQASSLEAQAAAQKAVDWLKTQQQSDGGFEVAGFPGFETPDAVLAIAEQAQTTSTWNPSVGFSAVDAVRYGGSGPSPLDALDNLAEQAVTDGASGTAAKLIVLDAMPLGIDPSDFDPSGDSASPVDLSATLDPGGCSADTASFGFFSQTLYGILAKYLICSGNVPPSAISAVRNAQQANGGWNYLGDPNGTDIDIDTTGLAIQALVAGGADKSDPAVSKALGLLARAHNLDGSWNSPFASGDPNSTALGILGVTVASSCWRDEFFPEGAGRPYVSPDSWLISRQDADGHIQSPNDSWGVNTFATSQSVEALLRGWLPVSRAGSAACTRRAYLAEGATAGGFETWVLLSNPNPAADASARLTFLTGEGPRPGPVVTVPPLARRSVRVDDYVTSFDVSTVVESLDPDFPVYSERAVYSTSPGKEGAHLGKEIRKPAGSWFLPEGATAGGFETWVLVANPDETQSADVTVTYLTGSGQVPGPSFTLAPGSRRSIRVNDTVPSDFDVATKVSSSGAGVVAERALYSNHPTLGITSSSGEGVGWTADKWFLPEGATAGGFETWVLIANPDETQSADVTVTYLTGSGQVPGPSFTLAPGSRRSIRVNDTVPSDFDVATKVSSSGAGVVVDHSIYSPASLSGDASGGPGLPAS